MFLFLALGFYFLLFGFCFNFFCMIWSGWDSAKGFTNEENDQPCNTEPLCLLLIFYISGSQPLHVR